MSNEPSDQSNDYPNQTTEPPEDTEQFSIWWPQTKQGSDLWKLLLGVVAAIGALREYLSDSYFDWCSDFFPLLVSAVSSAALWYVILVVVRYLAYWFSEARRR